MIDFEKMWIKICIYLLGVIFSIFTLILLGKCGAIDNSYFDISIVVVILLLIKVCPLIKSIKLFTLRKSLWNVIIFNIFSLLTIFILSYIIYFRSFNMIGASNLYNFISDDKIHKINQDKVLMLQIEKALSKIADNEGVSKIDGKLDLYKLSEVVSNNKQKSQQIFMDNKIISQKFTEYNIKFEDILTYFNNYNKLQSNLIYAGYYIGTLIFLCIIYCKYKEIFIADDYDLFKIKMRRSIYTFAVIIYFISFIDISNDGLVSYIMNIKSGESVNISKERLSDFMKFITTFKEGFLTFIIFDTIIDCNEKLNELNKKISQKINRKNEENSIDIFKTNKLNSNIIKKINYIDSKYDILKKNTKELEEKIRGQNMIINDLKREIKNLKRSKNKN